MGQATYELYLGDCIEFMRGMEAGSVDAVVTDPPYGVDFRGSDWDTFIPQWIGEARRIAGVIIFTTAPTTLWDYPRPDWVSCWHRTASQSRNIFGGFNHYSPIVVYGKCNFPIDVYYTNGMITAIANKGIDHPTPKDLGLYRWLVENSLGQKIFDPFMGSGTTGVACMQLGRNFIGCEIDPKYYAIAEKRIGEAASQLTMF
jgi:site-specific DNA-methyltransferase (adenine-specific)